MEDFNIPAVDKLDVVDLIRFLYAIERHSLPTTLPPYLLFDGFYLTHLNEDGEEISYDVGILGLFSHRADDDVWYIFFSEDPIPYDNHNENEIVVLVIKKGICNYYEGTYEEDDTIQFAEGEVKRIFSMSENCFLEDL